MKTKSKLEAEFARQVGMLRGIGQFQMLRLIVQEFQNKPEQPAVQMAWPPQIETRTHE